MNETSPTFLDTYNAMTIGFVFSPRPPIDSTFPTSSTAYQRRTTQPNAAGSFSKS